MIQHYRTTQRCFVGCPDPSLTYLLVDGGAPQGAIKGEDCLGFNPNRLQAQRTWGRWKIIEGSHWLPHFGSNEGEARQALAVIDKHGFTHTCYVGRLSPSLTYLRKGDGASTQPSSAQREKRVRDEEPPPAPSRSVIHSRITGPRASVIVRVHLLDAQGELAESVKPDARGEYAFKRLAEGRYQVTLSEGKAGVIFTASPGRSANVAVNGRNAVKQDFGVR